MYSVHKQFKRFNSNSNYTLELFRDHSVSTKENYIFLSGLLNFLWQSWNGFWRTFWLTYLFGGIDFKKSLICKVPFFQGKKENEILYYLLFVLGKRSKITGEIFGSYQEPTWGDIDIILDIANQLKFPGEAIDLIRINVLNSFSVLGDTVKHFQAIRNATIHLDNYNMNYINSNVVPFYSIAQLNYPTDILFARDLRSSKIAFKQWVDDLNAVLTLIYI